MLQNFILISDEVIWIAGQDKTLMVFDLFEKI
jgi:hypothetical protein